MTKPQADAVYSSDDKTALGFWIYLMTDCVLFASLFASFIVLRGNSLQTGAGEQLFSLPYVLTETLLLLTSSFTCGLAVLSANQRNKQAVITWLLITLVLGAAFLGMELLEFSKLVNEGNGWQRSGFMSGFFTLVATHGLHISVGLLWLAFLLKKIYRHGIDRSIELKRLALFSLFWHFLDVIWIFIFTIVYLMGAM